MPSASVHRPSRTASIVACTTLLVAAVAGCSSEDDGDSADGASKDPVTVEITFADGEVTPTGERVELSPGQELDLEVTADEAGEIHVHSDPEQELEYPEGTKTFTLSFDRPGQIEVESHDLDVVILQLQVQ